MLLGWQTNCVRSFLWTASLNNTYVNKFALHIVQKKVRRKLNLFHKIVIFSLFHLRLLTLHNLDRRWK